MWPQSERTEAAVRSALHQGPRGRTPRHQAGREDLEALKRDGRAAINAFASRYTNPTSAKNVRGYLRAWAEACAANGVDVLDATPAMLVSYQAAWARAGHTPWSMVARMNNLRLFYRWAEDQDLIARSPARSLVIPKSPTRSSQLILTLGEIRRLIDASDTMGPPWPLTVRLLALTGMRLGELLAARHADLIEHDGALVLHIPRRKMGDTHHVVVPRSCVPLIPEAPDPSAPLIAHEDAGYRTRTIYRGLDVLSERAGVSPPARPHRFRASLVAHARDAGIPDRDIAATIGTTEAMAAYYDVAHGSRLRGLGERMQDLYDD